MSTAEITTERDFYEAMDKAIQTKNAYPSFDVEDIATMALAPFQSTNNYYALRMRVIQNLMNLHRN